MTVSVFSHRFEEASISWDDVFDKMKEYCQNVTKEEIDIKIDKLMAVYYERMMMVGDTICLANALG